MQTVNSMDPDETAHNEPSQQDLHCLPFCSLFITVTLLSTIDMSKLKNGRVHLKQNIRDERVKFTRSFKLQWTGQLVGLRLLEKMFLLQSYQLSKLYIMI